MSEMEQARIKSTNLDYLNKLTKLDLLVIDDFGLMDLDLDKCRDIFEVLDTRDGRKSTVVISQFPVSTWFDMFADNEIYYVHSTSSVPTQPRICDFKYLFMAKSVLMFPIQIA